VSESVFTSEQRKKVIYGREKHRKRRNKEQNNRKAEGKKIGKEIEIEAVLLLCLTSTLQPFWLGRPYQEYKTSSQHSYSGH